MKLPSPIRTGVLRQRYKRFLADIDFGNGQIETVHCANPGSMAGLAMKGLPVACSTSPNTKRKLPLSLEMVQLETGWVGINTNNPNRLVAEALQAKRIAPLTQYSTVRPEVRYGEKSRIDFLLQGNGFADCYLEIKNVHFSRHAGLAEFPDSKTERGARHLDEMGKMVASGHRAVMLYVIQRADCSHLRFAEDFDQNYFVAAQRARAKGVEFFAYSCHLSENEITLDAQVEITLPPTSSSQEN